jgi:phosphoribosyl 1,2-cyclic phosphodiesterase
VITFSLQSGSNGNAIYVETADANLLFDCGLTGRKAAERMAVHDRDPGGLTAVLVSHDHRDHVRGVGVIARRHRVPVHASTGTAEALGGKGVGWIPDLRTFRSGETLVFGATRIETISTPHDGTDGVAFVVEADGARLGIFTDLGHPFPGLEDAVASADVAYVESNYDPEMLERGPYPEHLRARIRGPGGHLSNEEATAVVRAGRASRLRRVVLCHLSQENNAPDVALETYRRLHPDGPLPSLAGRWSTSDLLAVRPG